MLIGRHGGLNAFFLFCGAITKHPAQALLEGLNSSSTPVIAERDSLRIWDLSLIPNITGDPRSRRMQDFYSSDPCKGLADVSSGDGTIHHPVNAQTYGSDEDCIWLYRCDDPDPNDSSIPRPRVTFDAFSTEDGYDFLYVYDVVVGSMPFLSLTEPLSGGSAGGGGACAAAACVGCLDIGSSSCSTGGGYNT